MLNIAYILQNKDFIQSVIKKKRVSCDLDKILDLENLRVSLISEHDYLQAILNRINKEIGPIFGKIKKQNRVGLNAEETLQTNELFKHLIKDEEICTDFIIATFYNDLTKLQETLIKYQTKCDSLFAQSKEIVAERDSLLAQIPNIIHSSVPVGDTAEDNIVIKSTAAGSAKGSIREFNFQPKPHWDLAKPLGLQMDIGSKIMGAGFYALQGDLARLEWALISYFLNCAHQKGYTQWMVPLVANEATMFGTGYLPKMRDQVYHMDERDQNMFLIPTAEVPLTSIHANDKLQIDQLPKKYCAWSACFRREAGAAGTDTRGLLRVHQFNKVELFKLAHPETSYQEHLSLREDAEEVLQGLELPYRVLELCEGDLSFAAAKCWDLEVWSPGIGEWLEVSSVSNFEEFQARRCNIRFYNQEKKLQYCHTINGSGLATPRVLVAIIENNQQKDGSILIPTVLQPYMNNQQEIKIR